MKNIAIIGSQWGDEGKGKLVDCLSQDADIVVRFQGGSNAGHTVIVDGKTHILHLLPSGILHPGKRCLIGNGVVLDPIGLMTEIQELLAEGVTIGDRLMISERAHMVMPYHKVLDAAAEADLGDRKIGTTCRGIGPCYADKFSRTGFRICDILFDDFADRVRERITVVNRMLTQLYNSDPVTEADVLEPLMPAVEAIRPFVGDVTSALFEAKRKGETVLFEGDQGALLDIDHGTYPFVTSSSTLSGGICTGTGVPPTMVERMIAVVKAYTTRVGMGPFPVEDTTDAIGNRLQTEGGEFGATTGRPRRCGWFDAVLTKRTTAMMGATEFALTKLDVLSGFETIQICIAYELDGKRIDVPPARTDAMERCKPIFEDHPGWACDITGCRDFDALPEAAQSYVKRLEELHEIPCQVISVNSSREGVIFR